MPKIANLKVEPLCREWKFHADAKGATGLRKYIYSTNGEGKYYQDLPGIGDSYDEFYPNCRCDGFDITYLGDNDKCPLLYTLTYSTSVVDSQASVNDGTALPVDLLNPVELITSVETSSEVVTAEPTASNGYRWLTDNTKLEQSINFIVNTTTIKISRVVLDLQDFLDVSVTKVNKVNDEIFLTYPAESVLYTGCSASPWRSETDLLKWTIEMTFIYRSVTGSNVPHEDGWNFQLRQTRTLPTDAWWQKPVRTNPPSAADVYLYPETKFDALFTVSHEVIDLISANEIPTM